MTNYTYEQRKMIAEYLENELAPLASIAFTEHEECYRAVNVNLIVDEINKLRTVTF